MQISPSMAQGDPLSGSPDASEPFSIISGVRSGLKREFAFAYRSLADLPPALGRTRSSKSLLPSPVPSDDNAVIKRFKESETPLTSPSNQDGSSESPIVIDGPVLMARIEKDGSAGTPIVLDDDVQMTAVENVNSCKSPPPIPTPVLHAGSGVETPVAVGCGDFPEGFVDYMEWPPRRITRSMKGGSSGSAVVEASPAGSSSGSVVVDEDERGGAGGGSRAPRKEMKRKMELKMSKKISMTKLPSNMRELLGTGLLEGVPVKYMKKQIALKGVIKGTDILCYCNSCKGSNVVSAYEFERHAGSSKKHPSEYIYLENGNSIRNVLEACKAAPLDMLETLIQGAISSVSQSSACQKCSTSTGKSTLLCNSCLKLNQNKTTPKAPDLSGSYSSASKSLSSTQKSVSGKITTKDLRLHKLVFMDDTLPEGMEVGYYVRGKKLLEGYTKEWGIFCNCCKDVVSPSVFEAHAGHAQRRKPYNYIYTSNGVSLHELSVSLSKSRKLSVGESDDNCNICLDGGELLLCDLCPRSFHLDCVGLSSIPIGDWHCRHCQNMQQREKCLEHNDNAIAAGRVAGVDSIEQIFKRCIRIFRTPETNIGGCVFCRCDDFSKEFGPRTVMICDQCEKEYHVGCMKDHNMCDLKEIPKDDWFCCCDCSRIHTVLQEFVMHGEVGVGDQDSNIIVRKHGGKGVDKDGDVDIRWRLLSGRTASRNSKNLLAGAIGIFHESFDPIADGATSRDLIPPMVYGRNTRDQDFEGMYCAVLTVNSSIVSTGILRVLGREVAELPLVATSRESQGQGYFQTLFSCIERLLASLKVKHFVLPAAEEAESIWTQKFGFKRINTSKLREYVKGARVMTFEGTSMLHKLVPKS